MVDVVLTGAGGDVTFGSGDSPPHHLADPLVHLAFGRLRTALSQWMDQDVTGRSASFWLLHHALPTAIRHTFRRHGRVARVAVHAPRWLRKECLRRGEADPFQGKHVAFPDLEPGRRALWEEAYSQAASLSAENRAEVVSEYRHPLLDRRLLEFMLSVPHELRTTADRDRVLQRRALVGLLPEAVRLRRSKGSNQGAFDEGLRRSRPWFELLTRDPRLAELGLVDLAKWRTAVERARFGVYESTPHFLVAASAECWLRRHEAGMPPRDFTLESAAANHGRS
ncbi:MAG: asparagine synthase-related protein [Armatimonadota bacterium]